MKTILLQIKALFIKNIKINLRNKIDVLREFVFPLMILALIIVKKKVSFFPEILLPFYFPLTYIGLLRKIFIDLVLEKSLKYKETLKIMGLKQISFTASWLLTFYIIGILIEIVMALTLYYGEIINNTRSLPKILFAYFLYMLSSVHMCFCITSFFSDPRQSIKAGSAILFVCCLVYFLASYVTLPLWLVYMLSLIPQANVSLTLMTLQPNHIYNLDYNEDVALGIQAFNVIFYFLLYLYLDEIVQNQYGISKSKFFCFYNLFNYFKSKKVIENQTQYELYQSLNKNPPKISPQAYQPPDQNQIINSFNIEPQLTAVKVLHLTKNFPSNVIAVDDISFEISKGELFCLLGHNGAGKTTTLNLLTGLIKCNFFI